MLMGLGNKPRLFCKKGNVVKEMKLELKDLEMLMEKFESSSLSEMSVSDGDFKFAFKKNTQSDCIKKTNIESATSVLNTESEALEVKETTSVSSNTESEGSYVTAPVSGIFYASSKPGAPEFVKTGDKVKKGDVLGLIEAMKVMNELLAPKDGIVTKINVTDETFVEYGQEIICLKDC